ncbi:MAG: zinc ribbon domain-containing protein [Planctomycetes bacterium]|nr:zinc ribbon domain-containing protein [Planctomycetota bacterium]
MPTYEYQCTNASCGHKFELFQSIRSSSVRKCPTCGKRAKRLIGAGAGLIFRGSGFYITDYRKKDYHEKAKAESGASGPSSDGKAGKDADAAKTAKSEGGKSETAKKSEK